MIFGGASGFGVADGSGRRAIDPNELSAAQGFVIQGDAEGDRAGYSVATAGDVNDDGFADLILGAYRGDNGGSDAGEAYVVHGGDLSGKVTHRGSAGADSLTGTAGADVMIGGLGDDVIAGKGGADVIRGGGGDDVIKVGGRSFFRIDGGGGTDNLTFAYAGTVDLGNIDGNAATADRGRISGVEVLDFTNGAANAVTLRLADLLDLGVVNRDVGGVADLDNVLKLEGEAGDALKLLAADGWSAPDHALLPGHAVYSKSGIELAVDNTITVGFV